MIRKFSKKIFLTNFWISSIFFLKKWEWYINVCYPYMDFYREILARRGGVGAGVSIILTCLPNRSGPHRSILERSFLRQKCVKLKNFNRWVHLHARNWDTALLWNFRYTYRKSRSKIKNFGKKIFLTHFGLYWIKLEFWILTQKNEKKFFKFLTQGGG